MKRVMIYIGIVVVLILAVTGIQACSQFGGSATENDLMTFKKSSQYFEDKGIFDNYTRGLSDTMFARDMFTFDKLYTFLIKDNGGTPKFKLPSVKPYLKAFAQEKDSVKFIWFGHSSMLLNLYGKLILFDPVFSRNASPVWFLVKRFQPPVIDLEELPEIDYVVITHDHYDHLDKSTMKHFRDKDVKFITALGVGIHLREWGIDNSRITELDWWDTLNLPGVEMTATPAQHFSGRGINDRQETLWFSMILKSNGKVIYFSGDSGYSDHFKQIGDKFGPIDLAFIETGQWGEDWREIHLMPRDFANAYNDLRAERYFPIHWGMFELSPNSWYAPIKEIIEVSEKENINLITSKIGEVVTMENEKNNIPMWKKAINAAMNKEIQ